MSNTYYNDYMLYRETGKIRPNFIIVSMVAGLSIWGFSIYNNWNVWLDSRRHLEALIFVALACLVYAGLCVHKRRRVLTIARTENVRSPRSMEIKYLNNEVYMKAVEEYFNQSISDRELDFDAWGMEFLELNRIMSQMPEAKKAIPSDHSSELKRHKEIMEELPSVDY